MKRIIAAAALVAAAAVPATAAAVPPGNSGGPAGTGACGVVSTPAMSGFCRFTGASGGQGMAGFSTGGFSLTHITKVNTCADDIVTGVNGVTAFDEDQTWSTPTYIGEGPGYAFKTGVVYTFTIKGNGFGAAGGQSTPGPGAASEPAQPTAANNWAGSEDLTGGKPVGAPC